MKPIVLALLAGLALVGAACGGDDDDGGGGNDREATALLERGFATDVDTGRIALELEVEVDGAEGADGPFRLELNGPFESSGPTQLPNADMEFSASGLGRDFEGRLVLLPDNAWVEFGGETYEVGEELWSRARESLEQDSGPQTFREAGLDPLDWMEDVQTDGTEQVSGTETTKVTGRLDLEAMLRDFNKLTADEDERLSRDTLDQLGQAIDPVEFETWIGEDDIWRRVATDARFTVPEDQRDGAGGLEGGRVTLDMTLDAPNEPVSIEPPGPARPLSELLRALGIPPELLLGPGIEVPTPG